MDGWVHGSPGRCCWIEYKDTEVYRIVKVIVVEWRHRGLLDCRYYWIVWIIGKAPRIGLPSTKRETPSVTRFVELRSYIELFELQWKGTKKDFGLSNTDIVIWTHCYLNVLLLLKFVLIERHRVIRIVTLAQEWFQEWLFEEHKIRRHRGYRIAGRKEE